MQAILLPIALTVGTLPYIQLLVLVERFKFSRGAKCKTDSLVKTRFEEVPAISHICALPYVGVVYGTETVYCTPARVRLF